MDLELTGKIAMVTGGSRGIGKAAAVALAKEGVDIALLARDMNTAEMTASEIAAETGRLAKAYHADTSRDADVKAAVAAITKDFGHIDILINSAAQAGGQATPPNLSQITDDAFWSDVNVKVMGYLRCAREVAPQMRERGWGRIVNISGLAARQTGSIIGSIRNVSVAALTKNLADELGPHGINVTCVHPGITRTEKSAGVYQRLAEAAKVTVEEIERRMAAKTSVQRIITATEVAHLITFLASPKSIGITGESIGVGGGAPGVIHY
jgi:NAD(P)-dependent dehydrogenase (short-subunit alcohol dehydrogenase family)